MNSEDPLMTETVYTPETVEEMAQIKAEQDAWWSEQERYQYEQDAALEMYGESRHRAGRGE